MKKRLNVYSIQNELKGNSAFFPGYKGNSGERETPQTPPQTPTIAEKPITPKHEVPAAQSNPDISERPNAAPPARPNGRRIITRNSFETYEDQMESLRKLSYREKMEGKLGSMSAMVREAIDDFLKKKNSA